VTIAKRPSVWAGMARDMQVICLKRERKNFYQRVWTPPPIGKLGDLPAGLRSRGIPSARCAWRRRQPVWERKLRKGKSVDQMAFYGSSLILPKLSMTRETSFPALTAL
jgi:hypothetical protein